MVHATSTLMSLSLSLDVELKNVSETTGEISFDLPAIYHLSTAGLLGTAPLYKAYRNY